VVEVLLDLGVQLDLLDLKVFKAQRVFEVQRVFQVLLGL
jgi:hypothetical protein